MTQVVLLFREQWLSSTEILTDNDTILSNLLSFNIISSFISASFTLSANDHYSIIYLYHFIKIRSRKKS